MDDRADQPELSRVPFGNGNQALLAEARFDDATGIIGRMGLTLQAKGCSVIVICGGADGLADAALERAGAMIGSAIRSAAEVTGAVLVDGGTSAGVMRLTGQARARWPRALPVLVGVAPAGLVTYPGGPAGDRVPLEENHSHFILADSSQWGGETRLLIAVAEMLAGNGRVVMVLAGGGQVARSEVLEAARRGWPVFAVAGTGGLTDLLLELGATYRVARRRLTAPVLSGNLRYRPLPPSSGIADPDLREIIMQADIRPVTGAEPQTFARQLAWELQEEPVLKEAWQRFATYDQLAVRLRRMFTRFQALILLLGVIATLLALIDNQVKESALHWTVVIVPILISVLIAVASRRAVGQRWVMLRAAAESIKGGIYRYRTLESVPAKDQATAATIGRQHFASELDAIETRLMQTEASGGPLTPYRGPLPPQMYGAGSDDDGLSPLGADRYLQIRVGDQLAYFHRRIRTLNTRRNLLQCLAIGSGAAGAILAAARLEVWIGLTGGASAAALAYLGYLQVDNTIVTYNQTASRLAALQRGWRALRPAQQNGAAFKRLVTSCEAALATELSGWVQQMNDALQDLRHDQATAASSTEQPENSGPQRSPDRDSEATSGATDSS
jgi:SLOG in TRPM, prokaryote/SMODS and SLOG-associating 2TM effector domain 1/SMODS and SLOG-associating 2TM effector domain 3